MDDLYLLFAALFTFAFGAAIGSFLNVVIYRLPANLSLIHPPSRCPRCFTRLKPYDNIPILGWLKLRGRCRHCHTPISIRYPLIELMTGILFTLVFCAFSFSLPTLGYWAFFSWLMALAWIDLDTMTLPNPLTQSGLVLGLIFQAILGWSTGQMDGVAAHLMTGVLGAVVGIWIFDLISLIGSVVFGQTVMGGGDAKLAAMMGAWLGWKYLLLSGFVACTIGAFVGGGGIALGWLNRKQPMPFGPFLAIAAILVTFLGEQMISSYLQVFFPMQ
jgi:leader peptidase (prepilin peptidase) / N-methyltransferase